MGRINLLLRSKGLKEFSEDNKSFSDNVLLEEVMELQSRCLKIESDNEKKEIRLELKKKIQLLELQIDELFEKKNFLKLKS